MGESIIGYVPSVDNPADNPADICTNVVSGGQKRRHFIHLLLHALCDLFACLIILLAEEGCGSWGGVLVAWATKYIIRWMCACSPVNLLLSHNLQH
jgi:hypothetical protein